MTWEPKGTAPATFSIAQALAALVSGDMSLSWLASFLPLVPDQTVITAQLCAAGPPPDPQLDVFDFSLGPDIHPQPDGGALVFLGQKLSQLARARVFAAYCELPQSGDGCITLVDRLTHVSYDVNHQYKLYEVPAGATEVRVHLSMSPFNFQWSHNGTLVEDAGNIQATGGYGDGTWNHYPVAAGYAFGQFYNPNGYSPAGTVQACGIDHTDYTPTPQPEPDGFIPRAPGVYPDLDAIGRELDNQELKLDVILAFLQASNIALPIDGPPEAEPVVPSASDEIVDVKRAAGVVLRATNISPGCDMHFGPPATYDKLGQVVFGYEGGLGPIVPITSDPFVILPLPPASTTMNVDYFLPSTGTYQLIPKV